MTTNQTIDGLSLWARLKRFFSYQAEDCVFKNNTMDYSFKITLVPGQSIWIEGEKYTRPLISDQRIKEVNERFLRERGYE